MLEYHSAQAQDLVASKQALIENVIDFIARKNHLSREVAEDFSSEVFIKLLHNDGAVFKKFKGNSSFKTYLTVVIGRFFHDYRDRHWGRWRPSTAARRLGETAILLERYMHREGHTFDETVKILRQNHQCQASEKELLAINNQLPHRSRRHELGEDSLSQVPTKDSLPDESLIQADSRVQLGKAEAVLKQCLTTLNMRDRLILRLHFERSLPLSQIAKTLNLNQKALYRLVPKILRQLRELLEKRGISASILEILFK